MPAPTAAPAANVLILCPMAAPSGDPSPLDPDTRQPLGQTEAEECSPHAPRYPAWRREGAGIMEVKELGHIVLYVRDLDVSRRFYRDVLGWKEVVAGPGMAMFSAGRTHHELLLIEVGPDAAPIPQGRRVGMYHFGLKIGTTGEEPR